MVDLSVGTPVDPPPAAVLDALAAVGAERGYPASIGIGPLREAASAWMQRRLGVDVPASQIAACIGTKELVAGLPHWLHLRDPSRDTVLYPAVGYPTYEMGAILAGCRAVPVPVDDQWRLDVSQIRPTPRRALCLWSNSPGNPAGGLDDLDAVAAWGRAHGVPVSSDECYVEFTWDGPPPHDPRARPRRRARRALAVEAVEPGRRAGRLLRRRRRARALPVRGAQARRLHGPRPGAARRRRARPDDDAHVDAQAADLPAGGSSGAGPRDPRPRRRRHRCPAGGIYLWAPAPDGDAWGFAERLAADAGCLVSPGDFYGPAAAGHVRVAMVQPDDRLDLVARLARGGPRWSASTRTSVARRPARTVHPWPTSSRRSTSCGSAGTSSSRATPTSAPWCSRPSTCSTPGRGPGGRGRSGVRRGRRPRVAEAGHPAAVPPELRWTPSSSARSSTPTRSR